MPDRRTLYSRVTFYCSCEALSTAFAENIWFGGSLDIPRVMMASMLYGPAISMHMVLGVRLSNPGTRLARTWVPAVVSLRWARFGPRPVLVATMMIESFCMMWTLVLFEMWPAGANRALRRRLVILVLIPPVLRLHRVTLLVDLWTSVVHVSDELIVLVLMMANPECLGDVAVVTL